MLKKFTFLSMIVLLAVIAANAQVPQLINYQAILTNPDGDPIDGTRSIRFSIHDSETGGTELWSETQDVTITDGLFSILLGSVTPIPYSVFDDDETYLELKVGSDPVMTPRKRLVSVAYAMHANYADHVTGLTGDFVESVDGVSPDGSGNIDLVEGDNITITPDAGSNQITISAAGGTGGDNLGNHRATQNIKLNDNYLSGDGDDEGVFVQSDGDVGIGKANPAQKLDVNGTVQMTGFKMTSGSANGRVLTSNSSGVGTWQTFSGDNLGNHTASQNIILGSYWLSGDGGNEGIYIYSSGDVSIPEDISCHGDISCNNNIQATNITASSTLQANGYIRTGTPSVSYGSGDIAATGSIVSDNVVRTGSPTVTSYGSGDIAATDDMICDDDAYVGDNLLVWDHAGINAGGGYSTAYALHLAGTGASTGGWVQYSDIKFKTNIQNIENPVSRMLQLNGVSYNYKTVEFKEREFPEGKHFGLIAQEVEKVLPEIVQEDEHGDKTIAYIELIPVLLEAIKQQQKDIEQLQDQVNQLKNR